MTEFAATYENKEHQITYKEFDTVEAFKKFTYDNRDTLNLVFYSGGTSLWKKKPNFITIYDTTEDDNLTKFLHQIRLDQEKRGANND